MKDKLVQELIISCGFSRKNAEIAVGYYLTEEFLIKDEWRILDSIRGTIETNEEITGPIIGSHRSLCGLNYRISCAN
jgi:hypothetical protein